MPGSAAPSHDHLDRLFRRLVVNLAALDPTAVHRPVAVAEIHERLVPYRTHRAALGLDTNEDYELTLMRLFSGERGLAQVFPEDVRAALAREVASVNPDTGLFRQFPDASLLLDPERATDVLGGTLAPAASKPPEPEPSHSRPLRDEEGPPFSAVIEEVEDPEEPGAAGVDQDPLPFALDEDDDDVARPVAQPREIAAVTAPCPYCGGGLPVGRTVLFCPHCGQNIGVVHCPTCGSELDVGWEFCITCGQKVSGLG